MTARVANVLTSWHIVDMVKDLHFLSARSLMWSAPYLKESYLSSIQLLKLVPASIAFLMVCRVVAWLIKFFA